MQRVSFPPLREYLMNDAAIARLESVTTAGVGGVKSVLSGIVAGISAYLIVYLIWFYFLPAGNEAVWDRMVAGYWHTHPYWLGGVILEEIVKVWCVVAFALMFCNRDNFKKTALVAGLIFALVEFICFAENANPETWPEWVWFMRMAVTPALHVGCTLLMVLAIESKGWRKRLLFAGSGVGIHIAYNMVVFYIHYCEMAPLLEIMRS
jgi:hypothetical protein